ncbi:inositol 2-dehydrogenase [Ahrensia sp. R2A130]|uniref:inositol 2-dehydrogenase n=1 Tax=Ahrensia sp. R2A130 TaxID=744979 RepID=UPI0001E09C75|nr:inositol 2-dehydrogenase [Ahrensia sp. R2A130]EFL88608.1 inositol 2-dehydrogenase [Ahrensia sp. R2A130]
MITISVLGTGRIGTMHADAIAAHPRAQLGPVFDTHQPSAQTVADRLGVAVSTPEAIFANSDVDAVLVASATPTHADFIEQAVAAGKPILCEKPIDLSLERVNACAKAIAGSDVPVQIGFNRRFDPGHRAAYNAVREGRVGDVHQVIITSRDPELPPRSYMEAAGGFLRDMTIHDFDVARWILSEEPVEVFASVNAKGDPALLAELNEVDTAMIIMRTASGKQCHINNSRSATYGYDQRIEVLGDKGMVTSGNRKPHEMQFHDGNAVEVSAPYLDFFIERYREAFINEIHAFVDTVENGVPVKASFEDGHRALILAEAAYRSIAEKRLVQVSEITG